MLSFCMDEILYRFQSNLFVFLKKFRVYSKLLTKCKDIWKTENGEIDFVVDSFGDRFYIQVTDYLASEEVMQREFGAYKNVEDNFPKYVLSMDKMNYSQNGIIHKNIVDWLLEEKK